MRLTREFHIPAGASRVSHKLSSAVAYLYTVAGRPCALVFQGKAQKPAWRYRFGSEEARARKVSEFFAAVQASEQARTDRRAADKACQMPEVGTILCSQWGYEQTNVEFYRVEGVRGRMVELVKLSAVDVSRGNEGWAQGKLAPGAETIGTPFRRLWKGTGCKVDHGEWAGRWNGRPMHFTAYA